ncbi:DUF5329 domain-containing protein [Delftia sp. PS-11]|uniref:DUF5329 domain-containing protein n=1 Tax=Delftia sp. PS-11 TaxID=2767222 RepID=UPI00245802DD|nr:DUF5329 domain-containing protein [Delftia sp. PS-11]KAJ8743384.1 DUF5329 domain-containing protein [Delftia sp. PS-11]
MRACILTLLAIGATALLPAAPGQAQTNARSRQEVSALLDFVQGSGCLFIRNGSEYSSADARQHLQKKREYLENKGLLNSAEDFITRAATGSSMSGKPYKVRCAGQERPSAEWLGQELARLRALRP